MRSRATILGTEWHHIRGGLLLRVSGDLKPSEAAEYEEVFLNEDLAGTESPGNSSSDAAGGGEPVTYDDIDTDAWRADLVAAGGVRDNPDLEQLYDLTVDDCAKEAEDLELGLTLAGARPDLKRINMTYVCPSRAGNVDEALESIQEVTAALDQACDTPANLRTQDQQDKVDAVGCY